MFDLVKGLLTMLMHEGDGAGGGGGGDGDAGGDAGDKKDGDSLIGGEGDDDKGADDKGADDKGADDKGDKPGDGGEPKGDDATGAPESYAEFDIPAGVEMDKERLEAALPVFKEEGLTQKQAQAVVNLQVKDVERQAQAWAQTSRQWTDELKSDTVLGGAAFAASVQKVRGLLQRAGGDDISDLQDFFNSTGYGNYPPLFRFLHKLASAISEDAMPGTASRKDLTPAEAEEAKLAKRFPSMAGTSSG